MNENLALLLTTVANREQATQIANLLLDEQLACCVTILPEAESHYTWNNQRETAREIILIAKTFPSRFSNIQKRIQAIHPYECPEILLLPTLDANPQYLAWASKQISTP